jgi:hypothetical protein
MLFLVDKTGSLWIAHADAGVSVNRNVTATGIGTVEASALSLYPNPTNSIVTITGTFEGDAAYQVTDVHGKLCGKALLANHQIDVSNLDAGIYFIAIKDSQHTYTSRLIKQ